MLDKQIKLYHEKSLKENNAAHLKELMIIKVFLDI
jgi:hypothetical protein